jgi:hypothetical protein
MRVIDITFRSEDETTLSSIKSAYGIIVFWSHMAKINPTRIEHGIILRHLAAHSNQLEEGTDVVIGTIKPKCDGMGLKDIELAVTILIEVGKAINCPVKESDDYYLEYLKEAVEKYQGIRLRVWGRHPFRRPDSSSSRLNNSSNLTVILDKDDYLLFKAPWQRRRI